MRFATLSIGAKAQPVVISPDGAKFCAIFTLMPGFDGDLVDMIGAAPVLPAVTQ